jgi:hypothetical protein
LRLQRRSLRRGDDRTLARRRGGVEAHEMRGSHVTMLMDPFAAELAMILNAAIESAERQKTLSLAS